MTSTQATSPADAPERLVFRRVLVPVDGSALAESAVSAAQVLARVFGVGLELLSIVPDPAEKERVERGLATLAARTGGTATARTGTDVAGAILAAAREDGTLLCMASHGRGGLPRAILGSVARAVVGGGVPVVLVGPHYDPERKLDGGPVLACVDGSPASETVLPLAAAWAGALGVALAVVTVAEPIPRPLDERPYHRLHGPDSDAGIYVERLAARWRDTGLDVVPLALYDPLGPAEGLRVHLSGADAGLLVLNTRTRSGAANLFGSRAAAIIRTSPVPLLVVARSG